MAAILTATMLGLVYLTQTLASTATSVEIGQLSSRSRDLQRQLLTQRSIVQTEAAAGRIAERAQDRGLRRLADPVVLAAP